MAKMWSEISAKATRVRPPSTNNKTETALTAATPTAALATGATRSDTWLMISINVAFNITFNDDGDTADTDPANPGDNPAFPAGVYSFELNTKNRKFKVTPNANGRMCHWRSSR